MRRQSSLLIFFITAAMAIILMFALRVMSVGAAPLDGNAGGCGRDNMRSVACTVTDAGKGFVSGSCGSDLWFSRVSTARRFKVGQSVQVRGCRGIGGELYAPISIR